MRCVRLKGVLKVRPRWLTALIRTQHWCAGTQRDVDSLLPPLDKHPDRGPASRTPPPPPPVITSGLSCSNSPVSAMQPSVGAKSFIVYRVWWNCCLKFDCFPWFTGSLMSLIQVPPPSDSLNDWVGSLWVMWLLWVSESPDHSVQSQLEWNKCVMLRWIWWKSATLALFFTVLSPTIVRKVTHKKITVQIWSDDLQKHSCCTKTISTKASTQTQQTAGRLPVMICHLCVSHRCVQQWVWKSVFHLFSGLRDVGRLTHWPSPAGTGHGRYFIFYVIVVFCFMH